MKIRRFTKEGSQEFLALVLDKNLINESPHEFLSKIAMLVSDETKTETVGEDLPLIPYSERLPFGKYLFNSIQSQINSGQMRDLTGDKNFWNWLSAYWLETLVKADGRTRLIDQIGESEDGQRWLLIESKTRFHRHLVSGPYFAYQANLENLDQAMALFAKFPRKKNGNILESGELWERLAGKTSIATGNILSLATLLFYDPKKRELRPNAGDKKTGAQAFSIYFSQLDLNLDYESMDVAYLLNMLPDHFGRWVPDAKKNLSRVMP
jgi:hypothetical protein